MRAGKWLAVIWLANVACPGPTTRAPGTASHDDSSVQADGTESAYLGGLQRGWAESGSATRELSAGSPARVQFGDTAQWILTRAGLGGPYGALVFRIKEPEGEGEFLQVRVGAGAAHTFRAVKLKPDQCTALAGGWTLVRIPMAELDPENAPFDTIVLEPFRPLGSSWVVFDGIALTKSEGGLAGAGAIPQGASAPAPRVADSAKGKAARIRVSCDASSTRISPFIYGIAGSSEDVTTLGSTARRWGGNPTSRYNWEGHFWNTAQDWFFENQSAPQYETFLAESASHGALSAVTVPMLGWVAKDTTSYSFPISVYGPQAASDQWRADAGNGIGPGGGGPIAPGPPTRTSLAAPPDWAKRWVSAIVARDSKAGKRSVYEYILDNEPMLWSSTHRDVHPEPLGYDELLDRSIQYASAIRTADRDAVIAGPAEWGWSGYLYSAKDLAPGGQHLDRLRHGDVPLVEWYLREMRKVEEKTGSRLLDVLDLHYYPQANNVYGGGGGGTDTQTQLLRLRSTRSLWDPTYVDESWIKESIHLLPRMKEWVDRNYPGRGISIGEWNFGGEKDITGALATAEALGRFAQFGVTSAFYWTAPPAGSPSRMGFLAYRNFDDRGGRFLDWLLPTKSPEGVSVFASRDTDSKHLVVVAINMAPDTQVDAEIDLASCGAATSHQAYTYTGAAPRFATSAPVQDTTPTIREALAPWSITVIDIHVRDTGESKSR